MECGISIHAPHEGERRIFKTEGKNIEYIFQSTLPTRGSDPALVISFLPRLYFNPRSPRGGATQAPNLAHLALPISIHAPHEGERQVCPCACINSSTISIHAPHEGERPLRLSMRIAASTYFNPRSPRGGATLYARFTPAGITNFNPRSPRGGATRESGSRESGSRISIHAPHEGERHIMSYMRKKYNIISIHAPHEGERLTTEN